MYRDEYSFDIGDRKSNIFQREGKCRNYLKTRFTITMHEVLKKRGRMHIFTLYL